MTNPIQKASTFFESIISAILATVMMVLGFIMAWKAYEAMNAKSFKTADDFVGFVLSLAGSPFHMVHAMYVYMAVCLVTLVLFCVGILGVYKEWWIVLLVFTILMFICSIVIYVISFTLRNIVNVTGQQVNNLLNPICEKIDPVKKELDCNSVTKAPTMRRELGATSQSSLAAHRAFHRLIVAAVASTNITDKAAFLRLPMPVQPWTAMAHSGSGLQVANETVAHLPDDVVTGLKELRMQLVSAGQNEVELPFTLAEGQPRALLATTAEPSKGPSIIKRICDTLGSAISFCADKCNFLNDLCTPEKDPDFDPKARSGLFSHGLGFASGVFGIGISLGTVMLAMCCCSGIMTYELMRQKSIIECCDFCNLGPKITAGYTKLTQKG